jgi:hypothetical protein
MIANNKAKAHNPFQVIRPFRGIYTNIFHNYYSNERLNNIKKKEKIF